MTAFEDSFPTAPPKQYRDVIDEAHAIIAAARARKWRIANASKLCPCGRPAFYLGLCRVCDGGSLR